MKARIVANFRALNDMARKGQQAYWAVASQIVAGAAGFVTSVILIRQLGLEDFGRFSIAALIIIIVKNFAEGLVFAPMAAVGPKLNSFAVIPYRGFVLVTALVFFVINGGLVWSAFAFASLIIDADWLLKFAPVVAFASATSGLSDFFRRQQFLIGAPARSFGLEALRYTLQLGAIGGLASFSAQHLSALTAVAIVAGSALGSGILGYILYGSWSLNPKMTRAAGRRHWNFTRWMFPSLFFETLQSNFPLFYTTFILGEAALGLVRVVQQVAALLNLPVNSLAQVIPGIAARILSKRGLLATQTFLNLTGSIMTILAISMGFLVFVISDQLSEQMNITDYYGFKVLVGLFAFINVVNSIRFSSLVLINTTENTRANLLASMAGALVSILTSALLLNMLGEKVVPVALSLVAIVNWFVIYRCMKGENLFVQREQVFQ